jgi:hypothetical protein
MDAARVRCLGFDSVAVNGAMCAVRFEGSHARFLLPLAVARALTLLRERRTLRAHAETLSERIAGADRASLERLVHELARAGALRTAAEVVAECRAAAPRAPHHAIDAVGFVTRDRVSQLCTALASYCDNARAHGHDPEYVVLDDGRGAEAARAELAVFSRVRGVRVRWAGPAEKRRFAEEIARKSRVRREIAQFALLGAPELGATIGANRNALLFATLGSRLLSADDDTACIARRAPERDAVLTLSSNADPTGFWCFGSRDEVLASAPDEQIDVLGDHAKVLGRAIGDVLVEHGGPVDAERASAEILGAMQHRTGQVRVTLNGIFGDSGMHSGTALLWVTTAGTRERLAASRDAFASAMRSREVMRVSPGLRIGLGAPCMSTILGLDNRDLLPPFLPSLRGEDTLFGVVVTRTMPAALFAHLPFALLHSPPPRGAYSPDFLAAAAESRAIDLFVMLAGETRMPGAAGPAERMEHLGSRLRAFADAPLHRFERDVRDLLALRAEKLAAKSEAALRAWPDAPPHFAEALQWHAARTRAAVARPDFVLPADIVAQVGPDEALRATRGLVHRFGALLEAWPSMVRAAHDLERLGAPV